ncbi:hypothetical protein HMPREF0044_1226 [Gleimia coleocanis DSM 15436]|uniref:CT398-like coiled coil hairpin domain-containing protein n=1 Tax=Gleimia coleocanis DSM 15436 TaxID=525245 RepID=C0W1D6_9ACTO|nr:hypothetical protein [Gleimia coleocanis]EEH63509.1 hypothetical protein HMPREF0044_1226 [Gleimia coleocanis DSM 15436]
MRASKAQQQALLEVQELDTRIAQLTASRKKHPAFLALSELAGRKSDLERAAAGVSSKHADIKREQAVIENDIARIQARQEVMGQRLANGEGSAKDLVAIQHELNQMATRREKVEAQLMEVMERLETSSADMDAVKAQVAGLAADAEKARAEYKAAMGEVDVELSEKQARRANLVADMDAELLEEYEYCQKRSGLGVVAAKGRQLVGMVNALSEYEWHQINTLAEDEVYYSEDMECLIVKLAD